MLRRNFAVRLTKANNKHLTQSTLRPKKHFTFVKTPQDASRVETQIIEAWKMVRNVGMDISD